MSLFDSHSSYSVQQNPLYQLIPTRIYIHKWIKKTIIHRALHLLAQKNKQMFMIKFLDVSSTLWKSERERKINAFYAWTLFLIESVSSTFLLMTNNDIVAIFFLNQQNSQTEWQRHQQCIFFVLIFVIFNVSFCCDNMRGQSQQNTTNCLLKQSNVT